MIVAHITDLHFPVDENLMVKAIGMINHYAPDFIVCTGDVVSRADERDMRKAMASALEFKRALRAPVFSVPGNHDLYDQDYQYIPDLYAQWCADEEFTCSDDSTLWVGINSGYQNTSDDYSPVPNLTDVLAKIKRGDVDKGQIARIRELAEEHPAHQKILCIHHHLIPVYNRVYKTSYNSDIVESAAEINEVLRDKGFDLVLGGHKHSLEVNLLNGITHVTGGSLLAKLPYGFDNSFNLISTDQGILVKAVMLQSMEERELVNRQRNN